MITCRRCPATFEGTRSEARRSRPSWEPFSTRTQADLDHGPMVCPDCISRALDDLSAVMLSAAKTGRM